MGDFTLIPCYNVTLLNPNRIWQTAHVEKLELPLLALQIIYTVFLSNIFHIIHKPLYQPRLLSQIVPGFLLITVIGPINPNVFAFIFPVERILNIEVVAHIGLIYYSFLTGLEMNLKTILQANKKATSIAIAGIAFPMAIAPAFYALHRSLFNNVEIEKESISAYLIWSLVLTVTGFPVMAHTLSDLKLLYTGLGKTALTAAMISDTYTWILFTLVVPFCINSVEGAVFSVVCTIIFIVVCISVLHPILARFINNKTDKDEWTNEELVFVVMGAFAFSYITDILGTHGIVGAFVYGLILPHGRFSDMVISISDDFGAGFFAPIYFAGNGVKLRLIFIFMQHNWPLILLVILLLCVPKILSTMMATFFFGMGNQEGLALGLLMNTKGVMALVMLTISWDRSIFSPQTYAVMFSSVLLMTVVVGPIINIMYRPKKRFEQNKLKTIQKLRADAELRMVVCVHNTRQATGMINIIESFNATRISPIQVFSLYLIELTRRGAAMVAAQMEKPSNHPGAQDLTTTQAESESITGAFKAFEEEHDAARIHTMSIMSDYDTIHEDIHNTSNEKHVSLIILPFHKQLTSAGVLETTSLAYRDINLKVMQHAPCSVGIFVNRGVGSLPKVNFRILMLFVGGPDDREALAVAWRMAGHRGIALSVVRFLLFDEMAEVDTSTHAEAQGLLNAVLDNEQQKELDDEYVSSFRLKAVNMSDDSISYSEIDIHTGDHINAALNEMEKANCDLYIVGQGNCRSSHVFSSLLDWCDCSELGVIGDILASNNFGSRSSVLVVHQYGYGGMAFGKNPNLMANKYDGFESTV